MLIEEEIRSIRGVVGAVLIEDTFSDETDLEVFIRKGVDAGEIRQVIDEILTLHGRMKSMGRVSVHELSEKSAKSGIRLMSQTRPSIRKVSVASPTADAPDSKAQVNLVWGGYESAGTGKARRTDHSLRLVAATTLEAAQALVGQGGLFSLDAASLVEVMRRQIVMVIVRTGPSTNDVVVGAALVRDAPVYDAAVRAALNAVNRRLGLLASGTDDE